MAGLLQRRRERAAMQAQQRSCFVCGHPVLALHGVIEIEGRVFHDTCLQGSVEGRAYERLYGDRSGDVKRAAGRRGNR